ncbi:HipA domain-containing protein [Candidatus Marithrix sp. Canyon 246]|uniref:HipA domain-containing protein n=1 Tax=Candidatus Marithrix sp. Canyon 246 TaxID=1827136 RepID=UPI00084A0B78|nr:HipA domain-containing protein [Candidatus Marithrix sp. Canyon 246]
MKLSIYKKNILVGYLSFDGKTYNFVYDNNYLCKTDAEPVSPKMPLTDKIEYSQKLFNVFEQLIPEGRDRKILEKKANSANDFDLLPWLQHVYGDLQFSRTSLQEFYKVDYANFKNEILATNNFPNILDMQIKIDDKDQTSSENMFKQIKKYLTLPEERLILLKYYFYSMLIVHEDMHTKNLSVRTEGKNIRMSPLYDIATTAIYQNTYGYETHLPINGKRTNIRLKDFYVLVNLLNVDRKIFNQAAAEILWKYTNRLPIYFEKLASMFPDAMIYKKSRIKFYSQKSRITKSISLADAMIKIHQNRIKQLKKMDGLTNH